MVWSFHTAQHLIQWKWLQKNQECLELRISHSDEDSCLHSHFKAKGGDIPRLKIMIQVPYAMLQLFLVTPSGWREHRHHFRDYLEPWLSTFIPQHTYLMDARWKSPIHRITLTIKGWVWGLLLRSNMKIRGLYSSSATESREKKFKLSQGWRPITTKFQELRGKKYCMKCLINTVL